MPSANGHAKRSEKGLLTPDNCVVTLIDHQPQMLFGVSNVDRQSIINNTVAFAKAARVFDVPVVLTTVETQSFSGKSLAADSARCFRTQTPIERSSMNAWDDKNFVAAIKATGRKKIVLAGLWTEVVRRPSDRSGDPRRLRGLRRRGLLRRRQPARARQRDEAGDPGRREARHVAVGHARVAARLGAEGHLRRGHGHREDPLRRVRRRRRVRVHDGAQRAADGVSGVRDPVADEPQEGGSQGRIADERSLSCHSAPAWWSASSIACSASDLRLLRWSR